MRKNGEALTLDLITPAKLTLHLPGLLINKLAS